MAYFATSQGRYHGLIRPSDLQSIERSEWDSKTLDDIAHPLAEIPSVEEKTPLYLKQPRLLKNLLYG